MTHFRGYSDRNIVPDTSIDKLPCNYDIVEQDQIIREIFAPHPVTGKPQSDLHFQFSSKHNPMVAEYIKNVFNVPIPEGMKIDDPDFALQCVKSRTESSDQYVERLQELCKVD